MRKSVSRSRNGCAVCKSKRLKCDEARPSCSRCERLGITCPGYQKPLKWARSSRMSQDKHCTSESSLSLSVSHEVETPILQEDSPPLGFLEQLDDIFDTGSLDLYGHRAVDSPFSFAPSSEEPNSFQDNESTVVSRSKPWESSRDGLWTDIFSPLAHGGTDRLQIQTSRQRQTPTYSYDQTPIPKPLRDQSSVLVEYYFKEVCGLMSCYDSPMNPYRSEISNVWSQSQPLYYITQSMAAACLSEVSPNMSLTGRQLRDKAEESLVRESEAGLTDKISLLAVVMLGMSRSWHDPGHLGQREYDILAKAIEQMDQHHDSVSLAEKQKHFFFYNSLVYWKLLLSFVTDLDLARPETTIFQPQAAEPTAAVDRYEPRVPHPQTGVGIEIQELVSRVGALVRRERKRIRSRRYASRNDIDTAEAAIQEATMLQAHLCAIVLPREATVIDSGDDVTPAAHLLKIAEAYRCMGLLQLFRNFPDLLTFSTSSGTQDQVFQLENETNSSSSTSDHCLTDTWLTCLALHILHLVQGIPVSSRSRSIQPLLLVAICSELSLSRSYGTVASPDRVSVESIASSPIFQSSPSMTDILQARRDIVSRLSYFENILAAKPVRMMIQLANRPGAGWTRNSRTYTGWMS
ncbi:unnamed protein product [Clonostachys solani]|uniref:Zn(2)-C6 fungal-type domain-containing protein n=1 Tax=Clonostachys solani TaxID=160281 RepID=A0A9P0EDU3_9HYPO|nr:unnamed protein product [Clonostachys solani]